VCVLFLQLIRDIFANGSIKYCSNICTFAKALGLSTSSAKFSDIKSDLRDLVDTHFDFSCTYGNQPPGCLAMFRLNVSMGQYYQYYQLLTTALPWQVYRDVPQAFATEEAQTETLNYVHRYFSVKSWKFRKENKGMVGGDTNSRSEYYVVVISRNLNFDAYKFI
jgi:hypothetical protein